MRRSIEVSRKPALRCAFILPSFAGGGAERVTLTLLENFDRRRIAPEIVVLDGRGPLATLVPQGIAVSDLSSRRLRAAFWPLLRHLRRSRPDVVFSTLPHVSLALLAARFLLPRKTMLALREPNMPSESIANQPLSPLVRAAYRKLYRRAAVVFCNSERTAHELSADYRVPLSRLVLLSNPIPEASIREAADPPARAPGPGRRFVAAGRLVHQKGFDRLIGWFAQMAPDDHLTILGEGPDRHDLAAHAARLGVGARTTFLGFQSNPWASYAGADAFILSSRWEGMSNACLEALACGTPVIAMHDAGGIGALGSAPGVTIVESDGAFVGAMTRVEPTVSSALLASLLPPGFEPAAIAETFTANLQRLSPP